MKHKCGQNLLFSDGNVVFGSHTEASRSVPAPFICCSYGCSLFLSSLAGANAKWMRSKTYGRAEAVLVEGLDACTQKVAESASCQARMLAAWRAQSVNWYIYIGIEGRQEMAKLKSAKVLMVQVAVMISELLWLKRYGTDEGRRECTS